MSKRVHQPMKGTRECCGVTFHTSIALAQHRSQKHRSKQPMTCPECGRLLKDLGGYGRHMMAHAEDEQRFWRQVRWGSIPEHAPELGPCIEYTGATNHKGYGMFRFRFRKMQAHRWTWERYVGPVEDGLELDHLCRNRLCCNTRHLEPVTHLENARRGVRASIEAGGKPCDRCEFVAETGGGLAAHRRFKHEGYRHRPRSFTSAGQEPHEE